MTAVSIKKARAHNVQSVHVSASPHRDLSQNARYARLRQRSFHHLDSHVRPAFWVLEHASDPACTCMQSTISLAVLPTAPSAQPTCRKRGPSGSCVILAHRGLTGSLAHSRARSCAHTGTLTHVARCLVCSAQRRLSSSGEIEVPLPMGLQHTCPQRLYVFKASFLQHGIRRRLRGCGLGGAGRRTSMPAAIFHCWLGRKAAHGGGQPQFLRPRLHRNFRGGEALKARQRGQELCQICRGAHASG